MPAGRQRRAEAVERRAPAARANEVRDLLHGDARRSGTARLADRVRAMQDASSWVRIPGGHIVVRPAWAGSCLRAHPGVPDDLPEVSVGVTGVAGVDPQGRVEGLMVSSAPADCARARSVSTSAVLETR